MDQGASARTSTLVAQKALLIGDAAHAVKPNLGQGCQTGLEDGLLLAQASVDAPF